MKISKKILGVAVALIMIFNVFAVGTFAAFPDDTLVYMGVSADKAVYAPGDTIVLTFSAKAHPELTYLMIGGQYEIAYNNAVFEPYSTGDTPADHEITAIQGGYTRSNYNLSESFSCPDDNIDNYRLQFIYNTINVKAVIGHDISPEI